MSTLNEESMESWINWIRRVYGVEAAKAVLNGQLTWVAKDWDIHRSLAPEATVRAYLGLTPDYPKELGNIGPSCTPSRKRAAYCLRKKATAGGMVQGSISAGH